MTVFSVDPINPYPMNDVEIGRLNEILEEHLFDALTRGADVVRLRYLPIETLPRAQSLALHPQIYGKAPARD